LTLEESSSVRHEFLAGESEVFERQASGWKRTEPRGASALISALGGDLVVDQI
jgi:hypothetical protein